MRGIGVLDFNRCLYQFTTAADINMRLVYFFLFMIAFNTYANESNYRVEYSKDSKIAEITGIYDITQEDIFCSNKTFEGQITKSSGRYPSIEISVQTKEKQIEIFRLELVQFPMSVMRSLPSIIALGKYIRVAGQTCGSGSFFYVRNIIASRKKHNGQ